MAENRLDTASSWLEGCRKANASTTITYRRGEDEIPLVLATIGKSGFEIDDGNGALVEIEVRDYLILAADLELDDDLILPEAGDVIVDDGRLYEVRPPNQVEPAWRYSDAYRRTLRIHTNLIGE